MRLTLVCSVLFILIGVSLSQEEAGNDGNPARPGIDIRKIEEENVIKTDFNAKEARVAREADRGGNRKQNDAKKHRRAKASRKRKSRKHAKKMNKQRSGGKKQRQSKGGGNKKAKNGKRGGGNSKRGKKKAKKAKKRKQGGVRKGSGTKGVKSSRGQGRQGIVYTGKACEYIRVAEMTKNSGCVDGTKYVVKADSNSRRQFIIMDGIPIIAFVTKQKKFSDCLTSAGSYTDVTSSVSCKAIPELNGITLSSTGNGTGNRSTDLTQTETRTVLLGGKDEFDNLIIKIDDANIPDLPHGRIQASGIFFDGLLYLCGGRDEHKDVLTSCITLGVTDTWETGANMIQARRQFTLTQVGSRLVVIGGREKKKRLDTIEILYPDRWYRGKKISRPRSEHCTVAVSKYSNEVIIVGGRDGDGERDQLKLVERFNIETGETTELRKLRQTRYGCTCAMYNDQLLVAGGTSWYEDKVDKVDFLDVKLNRWKLLTRMPSNSGAGQARAVYENGKISLYGTTIEDGDVFFILDLGTETWQKKEKPYYSKQFEVVLVPEKFRIN